MPQTPSAIDVLPRMMGHHLKTDLRKDKSILQAGKIIKLLPSLPKALVFKQPKARGLSTKGLRWRALVLPMLWVSQGWHRESCRYWSGTRAAALWSHFKGCPCWSTLVPAIPKP
ncbi:uncharacterized protein LOC143693918 [Agelaius phoeniceus]|uniref:uncharacterized protein LOC143693918 n=1 Tax=Agelaius phoeniceus TaxID=39638 RepID=UPI004055178E